MQLVVAIYVNKLQQDKAGICCYMILKKGLATCVEEVIKYVEN